MEGARRKFAEEPPQRLRARCLCGAACPGESHCCSGSVGPPRRGHADTLSHTGWHCHNPPAGVTGALLPAAKKKPALGTEHAPKLSPAPEEFPGEESAAPRDSGMQLGMGIPSASSVERFWSKAKAEQGEAQGRASLALI